MEALVQQCARNGDAVGLQALLCRGHIDPNQGAPLLTAVKRGHLQCVEALLQHLDINPNVAASNGDGATPLHVAAQRGDAVCLKALLSHPATDPNATLAIGVTPLYFAVHYGHASCVTALLAHRCINPNKARYGTTPLHEAVYARKRKTRILNTLLAHPRINPNLADCGGYAPLHAAVFFLLHGFVRKLLAHPCIDPNREVTVAGDLLQRSWTPLHVALSAYGWLPRPVATDAEFTACVAALLAHPRTQPDKVDAEGRSPLHFAILQRRVGALQLFLNHSGVDVNRPCILWGAADKVMQPPIHDAIIQVWYDEQTLLQRRRCELQTVFSEMLKNERVDISSACDFAMQTARTFPYSNALKEAVEMVVLEKERRARWRRRVQWVALCGAPHDEPTTRALKKIKTWQF